MTSCNPWVNMAKYLGQDFGLNNPFKNGFDSVSDIVLSIFIQFTFKFFCKSICGCIGVRF